MYHFGAGALYGRPVGGNNATPSYPQQFGVLQDVNIDIDRKIVELRGQNIDAEDVAPSDRTIKGKASLAKIEIDLFNSLFFGDTTATGIKKMVTDEVGNITSSTVTVAGNASYQYDLGVKYSANGAQLTQSSNAATGQYSVIQTGGNGSPGTYTFGGSDVGNNVLVKISYVMTDTGNGKTLTVANHLQGYGPIFELWLSQPYQGSNGLHLFACRCSKISQPMKRDGYAISDFEFQAFVNSAGNIMEWFQVTA